MKFKIIPLIIALFVISMNSFGQGGWLDAINVVGDGDLKVYDMAIDPDGNTYITGWYNSQIVSTAGSIISNGNYDIFLLKINSDNTHAWLKGIGGNFPDIPGGVELGADNTIYISGAINGAIDFDGDTTVNTTNADAFLANYNFDGTRNWVKIVAGGPKNQRAEAMRIDVDRIVISGLAVDSVIYNDARIGYKGFFTHVSSFDLNGNHLDNNAIGFKGPTGVGLPLSVVTTNDGFAISGYFRDSLKLDIDTLYNGTASPGSDVFLYKMDKSLSGQWVRRTTSVIGENVGNSVKFDGNDNLYLVGRTGSLDLQIDSTDNDKIQIIRTSGGEEFFIFKYKNSTGNLEWYTIDGSNRPDGLWDTKVLPDKLISTGYIGGDYYFGNDTVNNSTLTREVFVVVHDLEGEVVHAVTAPSEPAHFNDQGYRVVQAPNGDIIVAGTYASEIIHFGPVTLDNSSPGNPNIFLAHLGCIGDGNLSASKTDVLCHGDSSGTITLTATGGFGPLYDAFLDNGDSVYNVKFTSPYTVTGLPAGTYDITVLDNANCDIGTDQLTINQPAAPLVLDTFTVTHPICNGELGSIGFAASGGMPPYEFSVDSGANYFTDNPILDLAPGGYYLMVRDANGCETAAVDTSILPAPAEVTFTYAVTHPLCFGETGTIEFTATAGIEPFEYSTNGTDFSTDNPVTNLFAGNYTLVVKDANGCLSASIDTSVFAPAEVTFTFVVTQPLCFGDSGSIEFNAAEGVAPFEYSINGTDFSTDNQFTGLPEGDYSLVVKDANGCLSAIIDTSIVQPAELIIVDIDTINPSSATASDGSITVSEVIGGTKPYTYSLNDGTPQSENIFNNLSNGNYNVKVIDNNGCISNSVDTSFNTGIHEYAPLSAKLYPNPTSGQLNIELKYDQPELQLEVLSLTGQVVHSEKAYTSGGMLQETLDLSQLSKGMYMIRVDGRVLNSKVMVH